MINMKLYIPEVGAEITLTADWVFNLHFDNGNNSLLEYKNIISTGDDAYSRRNDLPVPCMIPAGETLKVERIYIRKGKKEFSSLTFSWKNKSLPRRLHPKPMWGGEAYIIPKTPVRFWAKLADVNTIEFDR